MTSDANIRRGLYPGTFDPVTNGHLSLIDRACHIFDEVIVAVAVNAGKTPLFSHTERVDLMRASVAPSGSKQPHHRGGVRRPPGRPGQRSQITAIIRGLRAVSDFEYEFQMALMNRKLVREGRNGLPDAGPVLGLSVIVDRQGRGPQRRRCQRPGARPRC